MHKTNHCFCFGLIWITALILAAGCTGQSAHAAAITPQTPAPTATMTAAPSATPTATLPPLPTASPTPSTAAIPTAIPTPVLPSEHFIAEIEGHKQYFKLGCETAAALDWARYFGYDFNEFEFQYKLPQSDNPDLGFVGDVNSPWGQVPPYGYGVYAGPIADLLNAYGVPALGTKGYSLEQIKTKLAADSPVIAWVIGNMVGGVPTEYTDAQGNTTLVAAYEHVVILTGYDDSNIRYMNNGNFYQTPTDVFLNSWGVLGNMVIVTPD